jgi:hypothetical protein
MAGKVILFYFTLMLCAQLSFSQESSIPDLVQIFGDEFDDNCNAWPLDTISNIRYGEYRLSHNDPENSIERFRTIAVDHERNFRVETKIRNISSKKDNGYGLYWGNDKRERYFLISHTGFFTIYDYIDGKFNDLKKWSLSTSINRGSHIMNKLVIQKINGRMFYLINDILVFEEKFKSEAIEKVGFETSYGQYIGIDYLWVYNERVKSLDNTLKNVTVDTFFIYPHQSHSQRTLRH